MVTSNFRTAYRHLQGIRYHTKGMLEDDCNPTAHIKSVEDLVEKVWAELATADDVWKHLQARLDQAETTNVAQAEQLCSYREQVESLNQMVELYKGSNV